MHDEKLTYYSIEQNDQLVSVAISEQTAIAWAYEHVLTNPDSWDKSGTFKLSSFEPVFTCPYNIKLVDLHSEIRELKIFTFQELKEHLSKTDTIRLKDIESFATGELT